MVANEYDEATKEKCPEELGSFIGPVSGDLSPTKDKKNCFTLRIFGRDVDVHKPLILLKISICVWSLGGAPFMTFFPLLLKNRGISLEVLSATVAASAVLQFLMPFVSGVVADKIGQAKPVLVFYLCTCTSVAVAFIFLPPVTTCSRNAFTLQCVTNSTSNVCHSTRTALSEGMCFSDNHTCVARSLDHQLNEYSFKCENVSSTTTCSFHANRTCQLDCVSETNCGDVGGNSKWLSVAYYILIPLFYFLRSTVSTFCDVTVVSLTKQYGTSYGMTRLWMVIGFTLGNPVVGFIISDSQDQDYNRFLYFFMACSIVALGLIWKVEVQPVQPNKDMLQAAKILLCNPDLLAFVGILIVSGVCFGVEVVYCTWYMQDIGASLDIIGLVFCVASTYGVLLLFVSKWIFRMINERGVFVIGLVSHGTYGVSLSFLTVPSLIFVLQILPAISVELFWVAVVQYCQAVSPIGMISTMVATASSMHFNLGIVLSGVYGGIFLHHYDLRTAYRVMGIAAYCTAALYFLCLTCLLQYRKRNSKRKPKSSGLQEVSCLEENNCSKT